MPSILQLLNSINKKNQARIFRVFSLGEEIKTYKEGVSL
jgi:hypothetical protein